MRTLRLILGDQLSRGISSLSDVDAEKDVILMVEVQEEATYVRHHKQKIVLIFSAMRHFAQDLRDRDIKVDYIPLDREGNAGSFTGELKRAVDRHKPDRIVVTEPGEYRVVKTMESWSSQLDLPVEIREDDRFLCSHAEFTAWAEGRKGFRMEYFYREMRRKTGWLMDGDQPEGGAWNYDAENRKSLARGIDVPHTIRFRPDEITQEVIRLVEERFGDHFGSLDSFGWAVTRGEALRALTNFVEYRLSSFGDYQDAMAENEDFLFHAILSPYINCGLLDPREVCEEALAAYDQGRVPLAAIEGFIRQILGWREYVRGIYWREMPGYEKTNFLEAQRDLPNFYWTAETTMRCMHEAIDATRRNAYAHHIQRLMVTGNFALLAGVEPSQIEGWYLAVYADAYDWVELPNTHGMVMHADGGLLGSKPYAASGAYIDRMSDYCRGCVYSPKKKLGEGACPFNLLYWNFMMENENKLSRNPRMGMMYRTLRKMAPEKKSQIRKEAGEFLQQCGGGYE